MLLPCLSRPQAAAPRPSLTLPALSNRPSLALLQQAGDAARAKECYERAATGQERLKSGWHAAKCLERAGELAGQLNQWDELESHYRRARAEEDG